MPEAVALRSFISGLYRITFLMTGRQQLSEDLVIEGIEAAQDLQELCQPEVLFRLRRVVIARAWAILSNQRVVPLSQHPGTTPAGDWTINPEIDLKHVRDSLLAIAPFPRCALLLAVLEGIPLEEAAAMIGADERLVCEGRINGLLQLTHHMASCTAPGI